MRDSCIIAPVLRIFHVSDKTFCQGPTGEKMSKRILIALCISCAMMALACSSSETTNTSTNSASTTPATAATPATTTSTTSTASEKIGVPECDDYIAKYDACVSGKVPEATRAQYRTSLEQLRSSWKTLAANPQTKASLAAACKTATEQAQTAMKSFNCTF
jgi:hypothetical protein